MHRFGYKRWPSDTSFALREKRSTRPRGKEEEEETTNRLVVENRVCSDAFLIRFETAGYLVEALGRFDFVILIGIYRFLKFH